MNSIASAFACFALSEVAVSFVMVEIFSDCSYVYNVTSRYVLNRIPKPVLVSDWKGRPKSQLKREMRARPLDQGSKEGAVGEKKEKMGDM
jgi:hypothetical protein